MDPATATGAVLAAGALALAASALAAPDRRGVLSRLGAGALAWAPASPLAARWTGMAAGLGLPQAEAARRAGTALACVAVGIPLSLLVPAGPAGPVLALALGALPLLGLEHAWARRAGALERDLPWILDFLTLGVQAGSDFEVALERAARARPGPLAVEVQALLSAVRMGVPRRRALAEWGERSLSPSLGALAGALAQADALGTGLSQVLKAQAEAVRSRRLQRAEARAQQAPVKLLFPLVFCFFPVSFLVLFGPIFLSLSW